LIEAKERLATPQFQAKNGHVPAPSELEPHERLRVVLSQILGPDSVSRWIGFPADFTNMLAAGFDLDLDIRRVVLGEIDIVGWKAGVAIKDGSVSLDPFQLQLNGSPVSAKALADLTVPGYRYDVGFKVEPIPLEPILNTFQPARRGMVRGTVLAEANVKGAGITGTSLGKNLSGAVSFSATNLNLSLENVTSPLLKSVINVVTSIPALIKNPTGKLGDMLGRAFGQAPAGSDPWAEELQARPLDSVVVAADLGNGGVQIKTARVQSAAFRADASGGLRFAPVLDNSPELKELLRTLAPLSQRIGSRVGYTQLERQGCASILWGMVHHLSLPTVFLTVSTDEHNMALVARLALRQPHNGGQKLPSSSFSDSLPSGVDPTNKGHGLWSYSSVMGEDGWDKTDLAWRVDSKCSAL
jgi:hypothetical protein